MGQEKQLLLVDDDSEALISLARALGANALGAEITAASSAQKALDAANLIDPHVAVVDLSLNQIEGVESGFGLIRELGFQYPNCRVIVLTGHAGMEHGVRSLSLGAASFLEKPADISHLAALIRDGIQQSELRRAYATLLKSKGSNLDQLMITKSAAMQPVLEEIRYASQTSQAVLITGETGTGKGLCAQVIYRSSSRSAKRFVRYQPNFTTADLVNSELFGHVKGSFTGATSDRKGLLAEAHEGTLFLDEIDELPSETQVALLGVLQDKIFRAVGSSREESANFRLISATNRSPEESVESGKLRKDFFHRVAHLRVHLPALRERKSDILPIAQSLLEILRSKERLNVFELDAPALSLLENYDWPGNIRELQAVVEGAAYRAQFEGRSQIQKSDVRINSAANLEEARDFNSKVRQYKISLISQALEKHAGNQVKAAQALGIDRSSMRRILAR